MGKAVALPTAGMSVILLLVSIGNPRAQTLEQCVAEALQSSPDARAASYRLEAANAMIAQARSAYLPRLSLGGQYARTDNPPQAFMMALNQRNLAMTDPSFDPNNPDDTQNIRLSLSARYRVYSGQRGQRVRMSELGHDAAEDQLWAIRNDLVYQVTRGYYSILQAAALTEVQDRNVASLEESLRVAGERFAAGSAIKTDVLNLEVNLAQAREDRIRAKNGVRLAVAALNTVIGRELVSPSSLPDAPQGEVAPPPQAPDPALVDNRPELRAATALHEMKRAEYVAAKRELLPTVNAFGTYDFDSEELSDMEESYMIGVGAEWEWFAGFQKRNAIREAKARCLAAGEDTQKARNELLFDLTQSHLRSTEAWERLDVTRKSVESAEEALRITTGRYEEGAADITELLTAQVGLTTIGTRHVAAHYDYLIALANLARAKGELAARNDR